MSDDEVVLAEESSLFQEPEDYYKPPEPPSFDSYDRKPEYIKDGQYAALYMFHFGIEMKLIYLLL